MKFKISNSEAGKRVDLFLAKKMTEISRGQIQQAIQKSAITINGKSIKSSYKLRESNTIFVDKKYFSDKNQSKKLLPEKIPLDVIYENKDLLVINKPAGLIVHPAAGNSSGTLVNAILNYDPKIASAVHNKSDQLSLVRPGIIHRLDKDTSGVLLVAKNKKALTSLSKQLQNKMIKKRYLALVFGWPPESGSIKSYLARGKKNRKIVIEVKNREGKEAISNYKIKKYLLTADGKNHLALVEVEIPTGRTHQIRVQFKSIGYPIIGDQVYNTKESKRLSDVLGAKRQMLHAYSVEFISPGENKSKTINTKLAKDFQQIQAKLKSY